MHDHLQQHIKNTAISLSFIDSLTLSLCDTHSFVYSLILPLAHLHSMLHVYGYEIALEFFVVGGLQWRRHCLNSFIHCWTFSVMSIPSGIDRMAVIMFSHSRTIVSNLSIHSSGHPVDIVGEDTKLLTDALGHCMCRVFVHDSYNLL